jgi:putative membrane protein
MSVIRAVSIGYCCLFGLSTVHAGDEFAVDTAFIRKAEQTTEQAMVDTRFALKMSLNAHVKEAARMLQNDGMIANRKLLALAVEKGWPAPILDTADTTRDYSDYHFISWQIRLQQRAIALYQAEADNGADTDLQAFARETLPALQRGLMSLRSLRSS